MFLTAAMPMILMVKEISPYELKKMLHKNPEITVIDLRDETEMSNIGFDCISIPYHEIHKYINFILENSPVIFYCKNGIKSTNVINYFQTIHKRENLYSLVI